MSRTTRAHSARSRKLLSSRERGGGTTWPPFAGAKALLARGKTSFEGGGSRESSAGVDTSELEQAVEVDADADSGGCAGAI